MRSLTLCKSLYSLLSAPGGASLIMAEQDTGLWVQQSIIKVFLLLCSFRRTVIFGLILVPGYLVSGSGCSNSVRYGFHPVEWA